MPNSRRLKRIKKSDYSRVLVTDTLPGETPIVFSNEGLYDHVVAKNPTKALQRTILECLVYGTKCKETDHTVPYAYKIRKSSSEFRRLGLIHPISQVRIRDFYQKFGELMIHYCRRSPASTRAPDRIAGTFYSKSSWENIHQYRTGKISDKRTDPLTRYSPSYFAYRGYDRMYKFFSSKDFFNLEKKFRLFWTLDVFKCFDSIYTHCLSWAIKDKAFTKKHVHVETTFAQAFDALMRRSNHNETNGIVIGPEVSRIFAELLFQSIDEQVILKLKDREHLTFDQDFSFRRYVDDVSIFANNEDIATKVYEHYRDALLAFNLHANESKGDKLSRPFVTRKSRIIHDSSHAVNAFVNSFLEEGKEKTSLQPKEIHDSRRLTLSFIEKVKSICSYNQISYDETSSYLISALTERIKKLANQNSIESSNELLRKYRDAVLVLLDVIYFLYSVAPSVASSYKFCTAIIVLIRFAERHLRAYEHTIKQRIYELTELLLAPEGKNEITSIDGFISLEAVNVVLAARELGENYLLPVQTVSALFSRRGHFSYFDIVSGLFYVRDHEAYKDIRMELISAADRRLRDLSDICENTEKVCLFLDMIGCPYVSSEPKKNWLKKLHASLNLPMPVSADVDEFLVEAAQTHWFVNWHELDLLNSLEKKELKKAY
jgi:hypothetical protein